MMAAVTVNKLVRLLAGPVLAIGLLRLSKSIAIIARLAQNIHLCDLFQGSLAELDTGDKLGLGPAAFFHLFRRERPLGALDRPFGVAPTT